MSRSSVSKSILAAMLFAAVAIPVSAEDASPEGFWIGGISLPFQKLEVMVEIERQDQTWNAAIWVPRQKVRNVDMIDVKIEGASVSFVIPGPPGDPTFVGTLSEDGQTISGDYAQGGQTQTFKLTRSPKPEELSIDIYANYTRGGVPGEGLAGRWLALMHVPPHRRRLELTVSQDKEGQLSGIMKIIDQGADGLAVDAFSEEDGLVRFELTPINARFEGRLSDDGAEIEGNWVQGGDLPLTFKRSAK